MLDLGSPFYFCDGGFIGKISLLSADQVLGLNWQPIFDHLNLEFQILHYISLANYPHPSIMFPLREATIGAIYSLGIPSFEK
jgi:hypothetical protein